MKKELTNKLRIIFEESGLIKDIEVMNNNEIKVLAKDIIDGIVKVKENK